MFIFYKIIKNMFFLKKTCNKKVKLLFYIIDKEITPKINFDKKEADSNLEYGLKLI